MATPQDYQVDLQAAASQRINPFLKGLTMLTGGLAGEFTGTNEQIRERNKARQALLQEELNKRDEDRAIKRQLITNALQQGIQLDPNANINQMVEKIRTEGIKGEVMKSEGYLKGLGQFVGPSQYESDPRYQAGLYAGQTELGKRKAIASVEEDIQRPGLISQLSGFNVQVPEGATTGQLRSMIDVERMRAQSRIPTEEAGKRAGGQLQFLQQSGFYPSVIDINKMTPEQKIAEADIYTRQYLEKNRETAFEERQKSEEAAWTSFNEEASKENRDPNKLKSLYAKLPKSLRDDPETRRTAGITVAPTENQRKTLYGWGDTLNKASTLAQAVSQLAGTKELSKVSQQNFNGFKSWLRDFTNKFGEEDPRSKILNDVVQNFESVVQGKRKDLFAASLTNNELDRAKAGFGDPSQANFLPRMINFLDDVFSKDIVSEYRGDNINVAPEFEKKAQSAREKWLKIRSELNFGGAQGPVTKKNEQIQQLRNEFNALRSALTNAPSATR